MREEYVLCSHCGHRNTNSEKCCWMCGAPLPIPELVIPDLILEEVRSSPHRYWNESSSPKFWTGTSPTTIYSTSTLNCAFSGGILTWNR